VGLLAVSPDNTLEDIHSMLQGRGALPMDASFRPYYFTTSGPGARRALWTDKVSSLGLSTLSHLHLRILLPGGQPASGKNGVFHF
jgi:hypothetical protein